MQRFSPQKWNADESSHPTRSPCMENTASHRLPYVAPGTGTLWMPTCACTEVGRGQADALDCHGGDTIGRHGITAQVCDVI